jgi:hypothetical protein
MHATLVWSLSDSTHIAVDDLVSLAAHITTT